MSSDSTFDPRHAAPSGPQAPVSAPGPQAEPEAAPGYGYYGTPQDPEAGGQRVRHYLGVLARRRWSAMTAFVVLFTSVVIYNFTAVPVYQATARVVVEFEQYNRAVVEDVYSQWRSLDAELAILESRWLAKRTVGPALVVPQRRSFRPHDVDEVGFGLGRHRERMEECVWHRVLLGNDRGVSMTRRARPGRAVFSCGIRLRGARRASRR